MATLLRFAFVPGVPGVLLAYLAFNACAFRRKASAVLGPFRRVRGTVRACGVDTARVL